jgi:glycosyltransferase involved in cell wall biosynthesis
LRKTIRSVLSQDFVDFEIFVVDDGSTDATQGVIQEINDPRIHYIYQENGGNEEKHEIPG